MTTLTATRSRTMPRVNLLPPEIHERAKLRRVMVGLGAGLVATVAAVGVVYVQAAGANADAQDDLSAAQSEGARLKADQQRFASVPTVYAEAEATRAQMAAAMGNEVRMSYYLADLALLMPKDVWLDSLNVSIGAPAAAAAPAPGAAGASTGSVGTVTFSGKASKHDDVAAWLDKLAGHAGSGNPYISNSTLSTDQGATSVTFSSTADLTAAALSNRYTLKAGN